MENQFAPKKSLIPQLEDLLDLYLVQKAPFQLPPGVKQFIVNVGPWITLVLMILLVPIILAAIGLTTFFLPAAAVAGAGFGVSVIISLVVAIVELGFYALALPGLFKKSKTGWNFLFYGTLISAIYNLVSMQFLSLIVGTLISLYILFQIRSYYK